ncbi:MAG: RNA polymerase sigma factor [Oscillospiraceae bacterium]|jgi:RNA polymerase sigma-70 factor (ECF subfamily)|nr:RNA polymerase sigma factor [Oscillospiraceae bacterium]
METHSTRVFNLCLRMCKDYFQAEDLAQETFLAAYQALEHFDGAHEAAWLTRIASNKCLDHLRSAAQRRGQPAAEEAVFAIPAPVQEHTDNRFFESYWTQRLREACAALREPYGSTATAYYCEEKPLSQIAAEKELPLDTVQTRAYRAKQMLQTALKEVTTT